MLILVARRIVSLLFVLLGLLVITFIVSRVIPADPARLAAGLDAPPAQVEEYRRLLGLDQPLPVQFWIYFSGVLRGDLGTSLSTGRPVLEDLRLYFPATAELAVFGMVVYIVVGVPLGILAALKYGKFSDYAVRFGTALGLAIPTFVLALLFQLVFGRALGWFPIDGRFSNGVPPPDITGFATIDSILTLNAATFQDALWHLALPVAAIAIARLAVAARFTRSGLLEVLSSDYVRTARSKGLRENKVIWGHAFRNSIIPLVTVLGLQFGLLLGGVIFVEIIFSWPGLGRYAVNAIFAFDFPAVIGTTLLLGTMYVVVNTAIDIIQNQLDPRIGRS